MVKPSFKATPKRRCHHTFWKEILEEIQMKHCKIFFYLDTPSRTACLLEVSEPLWTHLPFGANSWSFLFSISGTNRPCWRHSCCLGRICSPFALPIPSEITVTAGQLLVITLSYPLLSSSRKTSQPVSWPAKEEWAPSSLLHLAVLFIQLPAWITPWFSVVGDPQGLENLASCTPWRQELGLRSSHQKWTELASRWRSGLMPRRISPHPSHTILRATAWIYFAPGGRKGKDRVCKLITERVLLVLFMPLASKPEPLQSDGSRVRLMGDVVQTGVSQQVGFVQPSRYTCRQVFLNPFKEQQSKTGCVCGESITRFVLKQQT